MNVEASLPLTRRASAIWARWRRGDAATRRSEERGLHPDEAAALARFERNLEYAGSPGRWFQATGTGIGLKAAIRAVLFAGLRIDVGAAGDVCRALAAVSGEMPFGGPLVLENEVRRQAGAAEREETPLCRPGIDDGEPGEEREVSIAANGASPKWKVGEAFALTLAGAAKLGIGLAELPCYADRKRIAKEIGFSEATVYMALKEYLAGRRPVTPAAEALALSPVSAPPATEELPPTPATCPDPADGAPTWFPASEPTPGAPEAEAVYPDGGHIPAGGGLPLVTLDAQLAALGSERDRLQTDLDASLVSNGKTVQEALEYRRLLEETRRELAELRGQPAPAASEEPMVPARLVIAWVRACEAEWKLRKQYDELKQQCAQAVAVKRDLWKQLTEVLPDHLRDQVV